MGLAINANRADFKHEVEYLEPGKSAGMKYHLLFWDGKQWSMLGPVWRVLKQ